MSFWRRKDTREAIERDLEKDLEAARKLSASSSKRIDRAIERFRFLTELEAAEAALLEHER